MFNKLLRAFIVVIGFFIGPGVLFIIQAFYELIFGVQLGETAPSWVQPLIYFLFALISGIIFAVFSKKIVSAIERGVSGLANGISDTPSATLVSGSIGLIIGLLVAALISIIIGLIPIAWISIPLTILDFIILAYLGASIGIRRRNDFVSFLKSRGRDIEGKSDLTGPPKILDTSVIIDGRIFDICKTGMFEGEIIIPEFVLAELQRIADSNDAMKRTRGRRGLDVLGRMQRELVMPVKISSVDYEDVAEVDSKLVKLARDMGGKLVTNDYNLNKVASVQDVPVFNINELANAVKPIMMAGEEMMVTIVKDGKEASQGIAYLDDGTMIVVEGAKGKTGEQLHVVVTSVLQTAAGRMIFAKND